MIFLGCDPDTQRTAWAAVRPMKSLNKIDVEVLAVSLAKAAKGTTGKAAVASVIPNLWPAVCFVADTIDPRKVVIATTVESQELVYSARQGVNPRDVALLGQITGAAAAHGHAISKRVTVVTPQGWKGSRSKGVHHPQICNALGWAYDLAGGKEPYAVPRFAPGQALRGADDLNKSDWKHVMDAIGLAIWGMRQWQQEQTKQKYLAEARSK